MMMKMLMMMVTCDGLFLVHERSFAAHHVVVQLFLIYSDSVYYLCISVIIIIFIFITISFSSS